MVGWRRPIYFFYSWFTLKKGREQKDEEDGGGKATYLLFYSLTKVKEDGGGEATYLFLYLLSMQKKGAYPWQPVFSVTRKVINEKNLHVTGFFFSFWVPGGNDKK